MNNILRDTLLMVDELTATNSKIKKVAILKRYPQCQRILEYVYDPLMKFHVTSANLKKRNSLKAAFSKVPAYDDIFDLLKALNAREITGHDAIDAVNKFIQQNAKYSELIGNILDKNLKVRIGSPIINDAFPGLINEFKVALAHPYDKHAKKVNFDVQRWGISRKMDGCRCLIIVKNGQATFWSRQAHEFDNEHFDYLRQAVEQVAAKIQKGDFVLDSELCIVAGEAENFKGAIRIAKTKRGAKNIFKILQPGESLRLKLFDIVSIRAFQTGKTKSLNSERQQVLQQWKDQHPSIEVLEQIFVENTTQLEEAMSKAVERGWEGLILRRQDVCYEGKRTANMLKLKKFKDAEFIVQKLDVGPFRAINSDTGLEEEIEVVTNIYIDNNGVEVRVGSGFSLKERKYYTNRQSELIGATVCVQYFEQTEDGSLRFPTNKHIYGHAGRTI